MPDKWIHRVFFGATVILAATAILLIQDRIDLSKTNQQKVQEFYQKLSGSQVAFTDSGEFIFPDEQEFLDLKKKYIDGGERFVEIDLRAMKGALYENGSQIKDFNVLARGREGTWWETPTGSYRVINKEYLHFSKLAKVWMPYATQFYGSFFIHGWPFYQNGTLLPRTVSGSLGCIRLADADAKIVFDFAKVGTRVLVLEDEPVKNYGELASKEKISAPLPPTTAGSLLVANLATGSAIIKKESDNILPLGPLTKFLTAISIADLLNPEQQVKISHSSFANAQALTLFDPKIGEQYTVIDLLYPLLIQNSDDAASILADFIGGGNLLINMNSKAKALGMADTRFADFQGNSTKNISTAKDLLKVLQHVFYKRSFLFDISKGKEYFGVGPGKLGGITNLNSFYKSENLIGVQGGKIASGGENLFSIWNISGSKEAPVAIIVLDSENATLDTENILNWVKNNFEVL